MLGQEITNGVELADSLGILEDEYYDAKKAREDATKASEDHATAMDNEKRSMEELLTVMFQMYNANASIVEQVWAYQDAQKRLQEYLDGGAASTGKLAEAERVLAEAQAARADELDNLSSSDAEYQKLLQEHHELTKAGTIVTRESELKMSEITGYMQGNTQALKDLEAAEKAVADARSNSGKSIDDQSRSTREYAELVLQVERAGQQLIGNISEQIQANEGLDASTQSMVDSYQSVRDAVIHVGLGMVQAGSISYGELEEWAAHAGIKSGEILNYWEQVRDEFGMIPNFVEIEIQAEDLATDMVEEIVGDLNDLEDRPTKIGVEIETAAAAEEAQKELEAFEALPAHIQAMIMMNTEEAETDTEDFIYGPPWGPVETEVEIDKREAERELEEFINKSREIKISLKIDSGDIPQGPPGIGIGHIPGFKEGGLIRAQDGVFMSGGGPTPIIVDPPEVVLNKDQALNAIWNMANTKPNLATGGKLDLSGKIQIQVDGEGASHLNETLVSDLVTDKIIRNIKEEGARS